MLHSPKQSNVVDSNETVQNSRLKTSTAADNLAACASLSRSRPKLVELRVWLRNQLSKTGRSAEVIGRSAIADLAVGYRRDPQASMVVGNLRTRALLEALSSNVHGVGPDRGTREPRWEAERQFTRESQSTIRADLIHNRVRVPESSKSLNLLINPILRNQISGLKGLAALALCRSRSGLLATLAYGLHDFGDGPHFTRQYTHAKRAVQCPQTVPKTHSKTNQY